MNKKSWALTISYMAGVVIGIILTLIQQSEANLINLWITSFLLCFI